MRIFNKFDVARKTWAATMKKYGPKLRAKFREISIGAYSNGREQGYRITASVKDVPRCMVVLVSEYRNSDSIVVYAGDMMNTSLGEKVTETIYEMKQFATPGNYEKAAKLVAKALEII
jgi:hypothetical protein